MTENAKPKRPGRKKGTPKTGGRQKGTRNRNSMSVLSSLDAANVPLIEFLVTDIQCLEPAQRVEKWFQLAGYCYPKLNQVDGTPLLPKSPTADGPESPAPSPPTSKENRLKVIRGQVPGKPEASG